MRLNALVRHLRRHGCYLLREGRSDSIWTNPDTGDIDVVPRHSEIKEQLAYKICRTLSIPQIGRR
jgi:mRNA interferase HicA